jgi:hypothetical protein
MWHRFAFENPEDHFNNRDIEALSRNHQLSNECWDQWNHNHYVAGSPLQLLAYEKLRGRTWLTPGGVRPEDIPEIARYDN